MKFCQDHWDRLRAKIEERGLSHLVAESGERAAAGLHHELEHGSTEANYDPLMACHWAITSNAMSTLSNAGVNPLVLMSKDAEIECPLCYLNKVHEETCTEPGCKLDKKAGYDWMLDRAADDALAKTKELRLSVDPGAMS